MFGKKFWYIYSIIFLVINVLAVLAGIVNGNWFGVVINGLCIVLGVYFLFYLKKGGYDYDRRYWR